MTSETKPVMPLHSSSPGNESDDQRKTETPELAEARVRFEAAITEIKAAGDQFISAGGNPIELMTKLQTALQG